MNEHEGPGTGLPLLAMDRHVIENHLAQYAVAMDQQDPAAAGLLLAGATLHFKDEPVREGREEIIRFYSGVFPTPLLTRHLVSNVIITSNESSANYEAHYQRWSLTDGKAPHCESIGCYRGRFTRNRSELTWTEHRVLPN